MPKTVEILEREEVHKALEKVLDVCRAISYHVRNDAVYALKPKPTESPWG